MSRLKLGGRVTFEGKLDVVVVTRRLNKWDILDISKEYESSEVPLVAVQVDNLDVIENYFINGRWVKPSRPVSLVDGIKLISSHLGLNLTISQMVLDCIMFGKSS